MNMMVRARAVGLCLVVGLISSSCGYSLAGRGSFLPESVKIIGIPPFENRTTVFNLETMITEKVRNEFIGRGRYTIQATESGADAVLNGEVTGVSISPISFTADQLASRYVITMSARAVLRDLKENKVLWENPSLSFREESEAPSGQAAADPSAFFSQDANALERMTTAFARSIVSAILEAF
jgi:hypothetical protein